MMMSVTANAILATRIAFAVTLIYVDFLTYLKQTRPANLAVLILVLVSALILNTTNANIGMFGAIA